MLIVRELVAGSERFNELRRGLPRMSPTLLLQRLQQLVRAGVIERQADGTDVRYVMTEAGHELRPVVEALGQEIFRRYIGVDELPDEVAQMVAGQAPKRVALRFAERERSTWDHRKLAAGVY